MSDASSADVAGRDSDDRGPRPAPPWSRKLALPILLAWLGLCGVVALTWSRSGGAEISGDLDGLTPHAHRASIGEPLVLLRLDPDRLPTDRSPEEAMVDAATRIGDRLASERVPLAPPAAELTAWMDAHALVLLPIESHDALQASLADDAMQDAVDGLKGRLSSPMFGVSGEQPRRDPLALARLTDQAARELGQLSDPGSVGARPTATGDLLAHDGRTLLLQLQSDRPLPALEDDLADILADAPVRATVVGAVVERSRAVATIQRHMRRLAAVTLAGLTIVLAFALRNVRRVLGIVAIIASGIAAFVVFGPPVTLLGVPLLALMAGFACEGALPLPRISPRGWPAAAVLGSALLPMLLSPYPVWRQWAIDWLVGTVVVVALLRIVLPALTQLLRDRDTRMRARGFVLKPMRGLAVVLCVATLGAGAASVSTLAYRGFDQPLLTPADDAPATVRELFFDPRRLAEAKTPGNDPADALARSAADARALATLVPAYAVRIESPGSFVMPLPELERRRDALRALGLQDRMDQLFEHLAARGFRPDAFGEFLRVAGDLTDMPTPRAALEGPLGPWIHRYLTEGADGEPAILRTRVHLTEGSGTVPDVERVEGPPLRLSGPSVAARIDRAIFRDWLGVYIAIQLWIGAFVVWLGTRSLAVSLGATIAALTAQTAVLAAMVALSLPLSPELVPALLLVGAAGMIAGGRACRAVELQRPFLATGLIVTSMCQVAAGAALVATGEAPWVRVGLVVAVGALAASGAGLFVAPGIAGLLRQGFGKPRREGTS